MYEVRFTEKSRKLWRKLDWKLKLEFSKKFEKIKINPEIKKNKLSWSKFKYKIKLKESWYRLIYEVKKEEILILVLNVWKRENGIYSD